MVSRVDELLSVVGSGGAWTIFVVIIIVIWGAPAVFSREGAEKLYLIGRVVKWVSTREQRSIERERQVEQSTAEALRADISVLRADLADEKARNERRYREQQKREDEHMRYIEFSIGWARQVIMMSAQYGWHPPLPVWLSLNEWTAQYRKGLHGCREHRDAVEGDDDSDGD